MKSLLSERIEKDKVLQKLSAKKTFKKTGIPSKGVVVLNKNTKTEKRKMAVIPVKTKVSVMKTKPNKEKVDKERHKKEKVDKERQKKEKEN